MGQLIMRSGPGGRDKNVVPWEVSHPQFTGAGKYRFALGEETDVADADVPLVLQIAASRGREFTAADRRSRAALDALQDAAAAGTQASTPDASAGGDAAKAGGAASPSALAGTADAPKDAAGATGASTSAPAAGTRK